MRVFLNGFGFVFLLLIVKNLVLLRSAKDPVHQIGLAAFLALLAILSFVLARWLKKGKDKAESRFRDLRELCFVEMISIFEKLFDNGYDKPDELSAVLHRNIDKSYSHVQIAGGDDLSMYPYESLKREAWMTQWYTLTGDKVMFVFMNGVDKPGFVFFKK